MQEKILNFDNLLRNIYLKTSGNPEAEKILKKIEEKKEQASMLSEDEMFEMHIQVKELIKESVSIKDIRSICEAAKYDIEKIETAYHIAELAGHIDNLVGFMIKAIKEGYAAPVKKEKKNQFNNFEQRQYDFDEYEKVLLNRS